MPTLLSSPSTDAVLPEVVESTNAEFGATAVRVAEQMRFRPARTEGKPVEVEVMLPLYFRAPAPAATPPAPPTPDRR